MKKEVSVTKKEIRASLDAKKIRQNLIVYFIIYIILAAGFTVILLYGNPTTGLILLTILSALFLFMEIYQHVRIIRLLNGYKTMPCFLAKLDKVNLYMNGKFPVFAVAIPTDMGTKMIETNSIYTAKNLENYRNHRAKLLYDKKKNRIYVITLED